MPKNRQGKENFIMKEEKKNSRRKNIGLKILFIIGYVILLFVLQAWHVFSSDYPIALVNNLS